MIVGIGLGGSMTLAVMARDNKLSNVWCHIRVISELLVKVTKLALLQVGHNLAKMHSKHP